MHYIPVWYDPDIHHNDDDEFGSDSLIIFTVLRCELEVELLNTEIAVTTLILRQGLTLSSSVGRFQLDPGTHDFSSKKMSFVTGFVCLNSSD